MKTLISTYRTGIIDSIFNEEAWQKLKSISDYDIVPFKDWYTSEQLAEIVADYDAIITTWGSAKISAEVLEKAPKLKFVGHAAGSMSYVIDNSIFERDIAVVNANTPLANATAEGCFALMMTGVWDIRGYQIRMGQGKWATLDKSYSVGINGKTIGLIGYGEISKEVIRLLSPFDVRILVNSRYCTQEEADLMKFELFDLDELIETSDIVSLHNTYTEKTRGMFGQKQFDLMRDGTLFVNTARAGIVDEQAMIDTLKSGRIYAALDVYHSEPLPTDSILLELPNVTCTPHIAGTPDYWKSRLALSVIEDLERWTKGEPLRGVVDKDKFIRMTI